MIRGILHTVSWRTAVVLTVALACLNVWPDLVGHGAAFLDSATALAPVTNGRVFFSAGLGACAFLFAVFPRRFSRGDRCLLAVFPVFFAAVTVLYAAFPSVPSFGGVAVGMTCAFAIGFGYGWFLVRLLCLLAQERELVVVVGIAATSLLLKTFLNDIAGVLPPQLQVAAVAATPLIMAICIAIAFRDANQTRSMVDLAELPKCVAEDQSALLAILIVNAILHAVTRAISALGFWGEGYVIEGGLSPIIFLVSGVLILASYYTLVANADGNVLTRFLPAFIVLLGGFLILDPQVVGIVGLPPWMVGALTTTVELYAHLLYWTIIVTTVRSLEQHPYRLVGMAVTVMCLVAIVLALFLQEVSETNRVVVLVAMYLFVLIVVVLFRGSKDARSTSLPPESFDADEAAPYVGLAREHGLSPRETEVFILLAQGRDRAFIQNELFISDATIKTHTQHIYTKLGVHSKQELISLVLKEKKSGR